MWWSPREAVVRTGQQNRVLLALGAGRFKSVEVSLGRMDDDFIEIISGLLASDSVVTSAQFLLDSESSKSSDFKRMHDQSLGDTPVPQPSGAMDMGGMKMEGMTMDGMDHRKMNQAQPAKANAEESQ